MRRFFIVPEDTYKAKITSVVFLILKETYLLAGSVIICSIGGVGLFVSTKTPHACVVSGQIMTSPSQSSLISRRWEKLTCVSFKMEKSVSSVVQ